MPVDAELDLAALDVGDGLGRRPACTVPVFGLGMRPRGPSTRPRRPTLPMRSGVATTRVEVEAALGDLVDQLVGADDVGTGGARLLGTVTGREDQDPGGLTGAVREVDGAADHLVGLARVDAQTQGDLDGGVELGARGLLRQANRRRRGSAGRRGRSAPPRSSSSCCASLLHLLKGVRGTGRARPFHCG